MKRVLLSVLMLLMLTPGLACAMPSCVHHDETKASFKPCHDQAGGDSEKHHLPITNADCAKIDLQNVSDQLVKKSDFSGKLFILPITSYALPRQFRLVDHSRIRGPPPDWPDLSETNPAVLQTTQRIRQ